MLLPFSSSGPPGRDFSKNTLTSEKLYKVLDAIFAQIDSKTIEQPNLGPHIEIANSLAKSNCRQGLEVPIAANGEKNDG
jgi:hypothetical protein